MKDSRIGAFGAMALFLAILLRIITLAALLRFGLITSILGLIAAQAFARTAMVWHWSNLPPAKRDGLAATSGQPASEAANFALATGSILTLVTCLFARGWFATLLGLVFATGAALAFRKLCQDKIGGHTGDTIGAAAILCELALLTGLVSGL